MALPPIFTDEQRCTWRGIDKAPILADPLEGTVEPLPEKCVHQLARGVLRLDHVPLRDTPLFLLDGTPW